MEFTFFTFADLHSQINAFCQDLQARLGSEECQCFVFGESSELKLGWRILWLKSLFDTHINKDVKDMALVQAMKSEDGPLQYLKQICGPIVKLQQ